MYVQCCQICVSRETRDSSLHLKYSEKGNLPLLFNQMDKDTEEVGSVFIKLTKSYIRS